jgi:undecaprenyl-diphosphatase
MAPWRSSLSFLTLPPSWWGLALVSLTLASVDARAAGGPLGIDHQLPLDQSGPWARRYQTALENGVIIVEVSGALWLGNEQPVGHSFWQSIDSTAIAGLSAQLLKFAFSRARPDQNRGPNRWFQGRCCASFPSGEVTLQAAFVTPFIVDYARSHPLVWALEALPAYDAVARLKSQAHWQTDVIAGWALGTAVGYWAGHREIPLSVLWLPGGLSVGLSFRL